MITWFLIILNLFLYFQVFFSQVEAFWGIRLFLVCKQHRTSDSSLLLCSDPTPVCTVSFLSCVGGRTSRTVQSVHNASPSWLYRVGKATELAFGSAIPIWMALQSETGCCGGNRPSEKGQSAPQQCGSSVPGVSHQPGRETSCRLVLEERGGEDIHEAGKRRRWHSWGIYSFSYEKTENPQACELWYATPHQQPSSVWRSKGTGHRMGCLPMGMSWNKTDLIKAADLGREKTLEISGCNREWLLIN